MRRRFVFLIAVAVILSTPLQMTRAAEPATPTPTEQSNADATTLSQQIAAIAKVHRAKEKSFHDELQAIARQHKELSQEQYTQRVSDANQKYNEYLQPVAQKLIELIKAHRTDPDVIDGIILLEGPMSHSLNVDEELIRIVLEDQLQNPKLGQLCYQMRYSNNDVVAEAILKNTVEKHAVADVRGQAAYALGEYYRQTARKDWGRNLTDADQSVLLDQAAAAFRLVLETYAELKSPDGKRLVDEATKSLARVTNIPNLKLGHPVPELSSRDLEGKAIQLSNYRDKVVVLVFWGSWCGPCMARVPHEKELVARMQGKPFALIGINCGDPSDTARETAAKKQMTWTNLYDGDTTDGPLQCALNVTHWPTLYVLDQQGIIRAIDPDEKELDRVVDELMADKSTN
jgi:thiol-disulfide isomerase/thioredoxin